MLAQGLTENKIKNKLSIIDMEDLLRFSGDAMSKKHKKLVEE